MGKWKACSIIDLPKCVEVKEEKTLDVFISFIYTCSFYCYNEYSLSLDNAHVRSWSTLKFLGVSCCMFIPVLLQPNFIKTCILKYHPNIYDEILYTDKFLGIITQYSTVHRNINITVIVGFKSNLVKEKRKPSWRKILQQMKVVEGSLLIRPDPERGLYSMPCGTATFKHGVTVQSCAQTRFCIIWEAISNLYLVGFFFLFQPATLPRYN